jgi:tetratricopeptide (TPR) repeat protein
MTKRFFFRGFLPFAFALLAVVAGGFWLWSRPKAPEPPRLDLEQVDPEVAEAITEARDEVLREPHSSLAWGRLGVVLWAHDYGVEANLCLAEAERLDPSEPRWPYVQGLALQRTDPAASLLCLRRATEGSGDGDSLVPRLRFAEALLDTGQLDEAEVHLQEASRRDAGNLRIRLDLGRLAVLRENWPAAVEHLTVCSTDPHARRSALRLRAQAYRRLGKAELGEQDEVSAGKLPEDERWPDPYEEEGARMQRGWRARLMAAENLRRAGRLEQAIALLQETAKKYPPSTMAWLRLTELLHGLGRFEQAEQVCLEAAQADPDEAQAWFWLGVFQLLRNSPDEAAGNLRRAIHLKPDHALAHFSLGNALRELKDPSGAAEEFRAALRCRPDYEPARRALKELNEPQMNADKRR